MSQHRTTPVPLITNTPPSNSTILRDAGTSQNTKKCPKDTIHKFQASLLVNTNYFYKKNFLHQIAFKLSKWVLGILHNFARCRDISKYNFLVLSQPIDWYYTYSVKVPYFQKIGPWPILSQSRDVRLYIYLRSV